MRHFSPHWLNRASFGLLCVGTIMGTVLLASTVHSFGADVVATNPPAEMAVTVAKVKSACFSDSLVVMGNLVPRNEVLVRPDREGMVIKEILVESGKSVNAGQALARLAAPNDPQGSLTSINAPVSGIILAAPTVIGETASARGDPLFRILGAGDLDLLAEVPAKEASRLAVDQVARIKVAGVNELPGKVRLVLTTVDPTTQLGKAHIAPDHNNSLLRVGAFARATITVGQACGVAVPLSALLFGPDGSVIQTVRDDRVETRRVTVGLSAQNDVQIREGLTEGDLIVVRAGAFLRDGDRVRAVVADE
jgi:multidrug efflux pump subunit AcrA (membrane-fusion protein)